MGRSGDGNETFYGDGLIIIVFLFIFYAPSFSCCIYIVGSFVSVLANRYTKAELSHGS